MYEFVHDFFYLFKKIGNSLKKFTKSIDKI